MSVNNNYAVTDKGYYGDFGGAFIPEMLYANIDHLQKVYREISEEPEFKKEFDRLLKDYVGRPSPLYLSQKLSKKYGAEIYLKREDLNHTGAHKINKLKDATNEAIRDWINNAESTHYIIGSAIGPHPYPDMVTRFQAVISEEIKSQLQEKTGTEYPDYVIACVGGGSNAAGAFYHFLEHEETQLVLAEAAGEGIDTGRSAATSILGTQGIGQIVEPHSVSAGLDYPGIGPLHAHLIDTGRATVYPATDQEAIDAMLYLSRVEGIIPALETAHALAILDKMTFKESDVVVLCLSGRGDKDLNTIMKYLDEQ